MEFEIICRNNNEKTKFRAAFDFNKPSEIPDGCKVKISAKTLKEILDLSYKEMVEWLEILNNPPLNFKHFWFFCQRFGGNNHEHGDIESYDKARLILNKLIEKEYKMAEIPQLVYASHDPKKIVLIEDALIKLECPIFRVPKVEGKKKALKPFIDQWNKWLDERRDPEKVVLDQSWGDLQPADD